MAGLQDEAEKSNEHLDRVAKILEDIREGATGKAAALAGRGIVGFFEGPREKGEKGLLDDPKIQILISALKFLADKATNQVEAMAKLEAALSLSARQSARETVGDIAASLARAGADVSTPEMRAMLEEIGTRETALNQAAMVARREAMGVFERAALGFGIAEDQIRREAADAGFVSEQVHR